MSIYDETPIPFEETYAYSMAHTLPTFPDGHKCRRVHGHTCTVTIKVIGPEGVSGYWIDHARLDDVARQVIGQLDHRYINDIGGLADGLAETQICWLAERIDAAMDELGGRLLELHHDEWSSGSTLRLVKHRKSWIRPVQA